MRNRANTPPKDEAAFIHGGSAVTDNQLKNTKSPAVTQKAKPVSISFFDDNLRDIDEIIREEMISGNTRVNRSDVVRAAINALKKLSKTDVSVLISEARQR